MMQAAMKSAFSSGTSSEDINAYGEPVAPVTRKLKTFAARLKARKSNATGATGPVTYDKDLLVDQLFVLNNAIQPLRNIVKEADTLMDMIQQGTSDFIKGNQEQTQKLLNSRIKKKIGNLTRKKGKGKKVKLQNLEKMI